MALVSVIGGRGSVVGVRARQLGRQLRLWDSIREGSRVWEWREGSGKLEESTLAACLVSDVLISQLRGHK